MLVIVVTFYDDNFLVWVKMVTLDIRYKQQTLIRQRTCVMLNRDIYVDIKKYFIQGRVYGLILRINELIWIGALFSTNNVLLLELQYGYKWTIH